MAVGVSGGMTVNVDSHEVDLLLNACEAAFSRTGITVFLEAEMLPYLRGRAANRFGSEGDDASGMWAPLSDTTQEIRESMGFDPSHPINVRTGQLEDYIVNGSGDTRHRGHTTTMVYPGEAPGDQWLEVKVRTAQAGKDSPATPPRPVLAVDETDAVQALTMLTYWLEAFVVAGAGL